MRGIEADSDHDEVSSQYDSCYSSGRSVLSFFDPGVAVARREVTDSPLRSDNTTTLFSEVTNYKFENGRRSDSFYSCLPGCPRAPQRQN